MAESSGGQSWAPTHRAPREGLDAWSQPDPAANPDTDLAAGVEMQVVETAGAWARVRCDNGWEGWVDGRLIEQLPSPGQANGDLRAYLLLAIAVAVLVVLAVMSVTG
jgi:hypothetical protein